MEKIAPALVTLEDGKPYAPAFGDIYATRSGAYGQACAVFLAQGEIVRRWANKSVFTILENGFGLGTNFLATLKAWREDSHCSQRLHFVSIERYPVSSDELVRFAAPEVVELAEELAKKWPVRIPGFHTIDFDDGRVKLTLIFHDSDEIAPKLSLHYDALYLDGFAPNKNEAMWNDRLLMTLARKARQGACVTTWCTAGHVRRALERAGFKLHRLEGFGKKSERLFGEMKAPRTRYADARPIRDVIVIGGGLSGANAAYALTQRGLKVRVVDAAPVPGAAASALAWGILHPHYSRDDNLLSRLSRQGFLTTRNRLKHLEALTGEELFSDTGCLQMAHSDAIEREWHEAKDKALPFAMPEDYAQLIDQESASDKAGLALQRGGWWFPMAGMVRVGAYCRALIATSGVPYRGNTEVRRLEPTEIGWRLIGEFGEGIDEASDVVIACAGDSARLLEPYQHMAIDALKGRITLLRDTDLEGLQIPVSGEGYIVRMKDGYSGIGATYELPQKGPWTENMAHEANLSKLETILKNPTPCVVTGAYCGARAVGAGRVPIVGGVCNEAQWLDVARDNVSRVDYEKGPLIPGLWVMTAMGSRGVSMSALCSEVLASEMTDEAMILDAPTIKGIGARRLMRQRIKEEILEKNS